MFDRFRSRLMGRLVLACFALVLLAMGAAPIAQSSSGQWVCSAGGGMKWVVVDPVSPESPGTVSVGSECPLCSSAPPPVARADHGIPPVRSGRLFGLAFDATHAPPCARPPLPPTGPPVFS